MLLCESEVLPALTGWSLSLPALKVLGFTRGNDEATLDITVAQSKLLRLLLQQHLPNTTVWAYGSRVNGQAHSASDLDLVAFALPSQSAAIAELREALEESNLPFRVDLFVWEQVPESFRESIQESYVVVHH